ncbi:type I restriction enzyme S subunit [Trinickia symbiotica]|uniref:Type I restriction endonuclease subunit S n=1 Tax=Trinickia symbiotica TaxID=863227 RepID=A0A2N7WKB4_9BURK|nr:restriction endonuclease subunit S [Trinickia symbiotica]PMS29889.1 type I restriction endonuclease subunit S [Trinickia symbiotica]PPK41076.1 type I restriction enzyme S subunit [Trinickia symbiotica]
MKLRVGFELLATAPDGIARLRELILSLAVQGKLVPQDPRDETADQLRERIRVEKEHLIAAGTLKRQKSLPEITDEELPYVLPKGWEWVRWNEIAKQIGDIDHKMPQEVPEGIPYVSPRDFQPDGTIDFDNAKKISPIDFNDLSSKIRPERGDLIYPRYGTIGAVRLVQTDRPFLASYSCAIVKVLHAFVVPEYQYYVSISQTIRDQARLATNKTTQPNVGLKSIQEYILPLPPFAEQARIVAKVDELMRLCDELETRGRLERDRHVQLTATLFDALAASESSHALAENWARVASHFDLLLDRPDAVDALEQTILQLAVRGLLVPQGLNDEPANAMLQKIRREKDRLIAKGEIRRDKQLPPIEIDQQRYTVPSGWEWVRLGTLCSVVTDGEHLTPERTDDQSQVPLVTAKNVRDGFIDYSVTDFVPRKIAEKCWSRCRPQAQDILMVSVGATTGRVSVLLEDREMVLVRSVTLFRPATAGLAPRYLELHLKSPDSQNDIWSSVKQNAQPCLYLAKSACLPIALPPLAEQQRIVARVDELRRLCADLRKRLTARQTCQARFAETLVDQAASTMPVGEHTDGLAAAA